MRNTAYKYFLYARKSSESEDRQMASIEDQIAEAKKLAERYNINIIDIISESKSAKEPGRIEFNAMLQRIQRGEAQGILTWKLNRLARNPIDGGQISWMLQKNIIKHIQTFERDYNPTDNVLLMQVEFGMANQYVKDLSLDIRRGTRQKAERGWYPLPRLPIGYKHNAKFRLGIDDEIIPDEEQFMILKNLWNQFLSDKYSISDIRKKGNEMGLKNDLGKNYSKNAYYYIFTNEFYCGIFYWKDIDGNLVQYKGRHKPLVTQIEFQKTQIILHGRNLSVLKERRYNFPYRGIIKCGECGSTVTPDHKLQIICTYCKYKFSIKNTVVCPRCKTKILDMSNPSIIDILYYHCNKYKGKCSQGSITIDQMESSIKEQLSKISITQDEYIWATNSLAIENKNYKLDEGIIKNLSRRENTLKHRLLELVNLRADGEIGAEQYALSMKSTQKELASIELEIDQNNDNKQQITAKKEKDLNFLLNVVDRFESGDQTVKTDILKETVSNLTLLGKKLCFTMIKSLVEAKREVDEKPPKKTLSNLK